MRLKSSVDKYFGCWINYWTYDYSIYWKEEWNIVAKPVITWFMVHRPEEATITIQQEIISGDIVAAYLPQGYKFRFKSHGVPQGSMLLLPIVQTKHYWEKHTGIGCARMAYQHFFLVGQEFRSLGHWTGTFLRTQNSKNVKKSPCATILVHSQCMPILW